ncbi:exosortase/archaeosortase family protein [Geminisphaera colitermitum]|uniref:exosortase/archaeosortase family protein n=1 Tax=Geminisphaera colitermitum TaxID=1148786 RepID=UPI000158CD28|nr:exosortase/archaeosortase family protein [Geminisphaera colitermitum]
MNRLPPPPPLSKPAWITLVLSAGLMLALCLRMWPEWTHNPDLSHGLLTPVLFLILLYESRRNGPWRHHADTTGLRLLRGASLAASVMLVIIAGLYAAAVDWAHPLVSLSLSLALSALQFALLLWLSGNRVRALPLNWPALVAIALWPLCAPIPPGTYSRLTLQLQFWITDLVLASLHLLGIPADTAGNVILLAHASVGVEEACSGIRSLLSCIVAALFFSATLVRRPWARVLLIALAPPLAFGMNILRSLALTLLANSGVDINGTWHDATGFAVLGITVAAIAGIAVMLENRPASTPQPAMQPAKLPAKLPATPPVPSPAPPAAGPASRHPWDALAATIAVTLLVAFFVINTRSPPRNPAPPPDLAAILPSHPPPGWDLVATEDLHRFSGILETQYIIQRTYVRRSPSAGTPGPLQITVYLAYWPAGQAPVSRVAMHTPDACWPAGGWQMNSPEPPPAPFLVGDQSLPAPTYRSFTQTGVVQNVWYWHLHDGHALSQTDPRSALSLLKLAWRHGFRTAGDQWFVRISSNHPWSAIQHDPLLQEIFALLRPYGL